MRCHLYVALILVCNIMLIVNSKSKNPKIIIVGDEGGGYSGSSAGNAGGPMVMDAGAADEDDVLIVSGGGHGGGSMMMIDGEDDKKMKKLEKLMKKKKKKAKSGPILILLPDKQDMPKYDPPAMEMMYQEPPKMYEQPMTSSYASSGSSQQYPLTAASSGIPATIPASIPVLQHPISYALPMMYHMPPPITQPTIPGNGLMMHDMQAMMMAMMTEMKMAKLISKLEKMMDYWIKSLFHDKCDDTICESDLKA